MKNNYSSQKIEKKPSKDNLFLVQLWRKMMGFSFIILAVSGCQGMVHEPGRDVHVCLDQCDLKYMGSHLEKRACEDACMASPTRNVVTTAMGPYSFNEGKNSLNERNVTAILA